MYYFKGEKTTLTRQKLVCKLENQANQLRQDSLKMIYRAGKGHPGGAFSATEIVTALYFSVMKIEPAKPKWPERDRFILSKGHACPVWYAALARRGFFELSHLDTLRQTHSILQGHPVMTKTPGVDINTGSLGNGLSLGLGMALASRNNGFKYNVYVILGDGEIQEGMVWEAAMAAGHFRPANLFAVVDYNGLQNDGFVKDILGLEPLVDKWRAFGWNVKEIDGHNMNEILNGFEWLQKVGGPAVIIAHTVKGKGVSFMENIVEWHGKTPTKEEFELAMEELIVGGGNG
ncbi:MAG: transketolase [Halanaerobiales bacterium]|nr:transketolase [Halanaerobiales bacterium]